MTYDEIIERAQSRFPTTAMQLRRRGLGWMEFADEAARKCSLFGAEWDNGFMSMAHEAGATPSDAASALADHQAALSEAE